VNFVTNLADLCSGHLIKQDIRIARGKSSHSVLVSTEELSYTAEWSLRGLSISCPQIPDLLLTA